MEFFIFTFDNSPVITEARGFSSARLTTEMVPRGCLNTVIKL